MRDKNQINLNRKGIKVKNVIAEVNLYLRK